MEKQRAYLEVLSACPQITSDYSFINLWGWAGEYGLEWSWSGSLVWIRQTLPEEAYWAPIGPWDQLDWVDIFAPDRSLAQHFIRVPENLMAIWKQTFTNDIRIEDSRGHWDYVYDAEKLIGLRGNKLHKKKNLVKQFTKRYDFSYAPLEPDLIEQALGLQTDWCTWRDCESFDTLAAENRVIQHILMHWNDLAGITGGILQVNGAMAAYTVAEQLTGDMLLIHFEKADQTYKGAYQAINQMFVSKYSGNFKTVNREQDLDDAGLRKAKLSYQPTNFLRKYNISHS
jgi:hypothetical protein